MAAMVWIKRAIVVAAIASLTPGCIMYRLEELRNTTPAGTPFQNELARLYMDFATRGEKEYDWFNSWHFADKGLMLAYGKEMGPEDLKDWDIPKDVLPEMERVRASLIAVLTPDLMQMSPSRAADAQFYFDCWVKYQEANWQEDEIANCRDNLMKTLEDLNAPGMRTEMKKEAVSKPIATAPKKSHKKVTLSEKKESAPETVSYAVFFETNKAQLSEPGRNVLGEVIASLKYASNYEIILHMPAKSDTAGLSEERMQLVKKRLVDGGLNESAIHASNTAPESESASHPHKRVEIFLNE